MIKPYLVRICVPPEGWAAPFSGRLTVQKKHFYGPLTVYHSRYWESVQAGARIAKMIQINLHYGQYADAYALLPDGALYRIAEAQETTDEHGLPVTNLSLERWDRSYELAKPD